MKSLFLLFMFFLVSCASGPDLNQMSNSELTDFVMSESMLTTALSSSSASALNCMKPFEGSMSKKAYAHLNNLLRDNFKYEEMYTSIHGHMMAGHGKDDMRFIADELNGKIWQKYLNGIEAAANGGQDKFVKVYQSLDEGKFDLSSNRSQLVARITDYSFMVNLVNQSNTQVMQLLQLNMPATLSDQQKSVLKWIGSELKTLNDAHIKTLFTTAYISTEKFTEPELEALLKIRSNDILQKGKVALEEELSDRYNNFLFSLRKTAKTGQK